MNIAWLRYVDEVLGTHTPRHPSNVASLDTPATRLGSSQAATLAGILPTLATTVPRRERIVWR
jgi:hypothetical protein